MHRIMLQNKVYAEGYLDALYDYAHWKDGSMYVGTCGKTYKEAKAEIEKIIKSQE